MLKSMSERRFSYVIADEDLQQVTDPWQARFIYARKIAQHALAPDATRLRFAAQVKRQAVKA